MPGVEQWEPSAESSGVYISSSVDPLTLPACLTDAEAEAEVDTSVMDMTHTVKTETEEDTTHTVEEEDLEDTWLEQESLTCNKCGDTFVSPVELNQHFVNSDCVVGQRGISAENAVWRYTCNACGERFHRKGALAEHVPLHYDAAPEPSADEGTRRASDGGIVRTSVLERCKAGPSSSGRYVCVECRKEFVMKSNFVRHLLSRSCETSRSWTCDVASCKKQFKTNYKLKRHVATVHTDARSFACDECAYRTKLRTDLTNHKRVHSVNGQAMFRCGECGKMFTRNKLLERHTLRRHTDDDISRIFICPEESCGKRFKTQHEVNLHKTVHCDDSVKTFVCDEVTCSKRFKLKAALQRHLAVHSEIKGYACDKCAYRCKRRGCLSAHEKRVHSADDQVKFHCAECSHTCKSRGDLNRHRLVHAGDSCRVFACVVVDCNMRFKTRGALQLHTAVHSDIKLFACPKCNKRFKRDSTLKHHMRIHSTDDQS